MRRVFLIVVLLMASSAMAEACKPIAERYRCEHLALVDNVDLCIANHQPVACVVIHLEVEVHARG